MQTTLKFGISEATFDTIGGELISYKNNGKEYLWTGEPAHWGGHAPVLFPFVCSLKDGKTNIGGKQYEMIKHGFARKFEFNITEQSESSISFTLTDSKESLAMYPFKFALTITHKITDSGFSTTFTVKNTDTCPILFAIGGHPGFLISNAEEYELIFEKDEDATLYYAPGGNYLNKSTVYSRRLTKQFDIKYADFDYCDALIAIEPNSRKVKLCKKADGKGIEFDFNGFSVLGIWSAPNKKSPFVCLEPWNGLPAYDDESGNFEDKPYVTTLPVGSEYSVGYKVAIID